MRRMLTAVPLLLLAAITACSGGGEEGPGVATVGNVATASASPDPSAPAADDEERKRQFTQCMRDEGIDIDDAEGPGRGVRVQAEKQKMQRAMEKCRKYLPNGGEPEKPSAADLEKLREYAKCMRENGVPAFPDPDPESGSFKNELDSGITKKDIEAADEKCRDKLPTGGRKGGGK
ncbi:hypothetical protein ACTMTJ_10030 [Phytohabitans sp. LJ34]|uniref:hypothetical protein n=1 Tax=Phytohabitans sp. LJ34 TaxID=3452217 RepID=UPI003F88A3E9